MKDAELLLSFQFTLFIGVIIILRKRWKSHENVVAIPPKSQIMAPLWRTGELVKFWSKNTSFMGMIEQVTSEKMGKVDLPRNCSNNPVMAVAIRISLPDRPYSRLHISDPDKGFVDWNGNSDVRSAIWIILNPHATTTPILCTFRNYREQRAPEVCYSLGVQESRIVAFRVQCDGIKYDDAHLFRWNVCSVDRVLEPPLINDQPTCELSTSNCALSKTLSHKELQSFVHNGFIKLSNIVPTHIIRGAKIAVNARLGRPGGLTPFFRDNETPTLRPPSGSDEVTQVLSIAGEEIGRVGQDASHDPLLLAPATSMGVWRILNQLIGHGKVSPLSGVQVALRFPDSLDALVVSGAAMQSRIDGTCWHTDGLRQGKKHSFSLLVGIALSDNMMQPDNGNLCVWPRSHLHVHHWMRHPDGKIARPASGGTGWSDSDGPLPDLGPPLQMLLRAGDVIIAHSEIAHCGGIHLGPDIRSMVYYRVRHVNWKEMYESGALVEDMWCDLEGLRHLEDAKRLAKGCMFPPSPHKCDHVCRIYDSSIEYERDFDHKCF